MNDFEPFCGCISHFSGAKPADLVAMEVEGVKLRNERMWEAHMRGGDKPGQVLIPIYILPFVVVSFVVIFWVEQ